MTASAASISAPAPSRRSRPPVRGELCMHDARHDGDGQQAEGPAHQPQVEAHVAIEDVAELVRHHALQLVASQQRRRAARHGDGGIGGRIAGGERVDAVLVLEHVDLGHGDARGDRHLLDHVVQAAQRRIARVALDARAAERARHHAAAGAQRQRLEQAGAADDGQHDDRGERPAALRAKPADPSAPQHARRRSRRPPRPPAPRDTRKPSSSQRVVRRAASWRA